MFNQLNSVITQFGWSPITIPLEWDDILDIAAEVGEATEARNTHVLTDTEEEEMLELGKYEGKSSSEFLL